MQRIAVLGASGVAGRPFVELARSMGHDLATARIDIFDQDALRRHIAGRDVVVNLVTSIPRPGDPKGWAANDRIRREGTAAVVDACMAAGVPLLVQQSIAMLHSATDATPQTEHDPTIGYGVLASSIDMEATIHRSPMDARLVRGGLFYGPGTGREAQWARDLTNPDFRMPGDGAAWLSPVHVHDFASGLLAVVEHGAGRNDYIVCDDQPLRWQALYAQLAASAGVAAPRPGGPETLRSFRVSNAKLSALGWRPRFALSGFLREGGRA